MIHAALATINEKDVVWNSVTRGELLSPSFIAAQWQASGRAGSGQGSIASDHQSTQCTIFSIALIASSMIYHLG
ncbi:hypothetical protein SeMB42_g01826 [Synchytrium endobioticum]|uniref:Uncharacterized protein n=1 Tax=Synchytrium endobioticum TaxID=286115 RepID=A0A507DJD7_9FUNG|nr:hypothetical protein SeLEV6574_g01527 [Synchytrium endobioticum]TPX51772.1 hypothetical protein SeMB42_g01826 [Synchytrium endobioticum]